MFTSGLQVGSPPGEIFAIIKREAAVQQTKKGNQHPKSKPVATGVSTTKTSVAIRGKNKIPKNLIEGRSPNTTTTKVIQKTKKTKFGQCNNKKTKNKNKRQR
jgi:hypothetical protein